MATLGRLLLTVTLKRPASQMDDSPVDKEAIDRFDMHVRILYGETILPTAWHNFGLLYKDVDDDQKPVLRFRKRFGKPSHIVDRAYRGSEHLRETLVKLSRPYMPQDVTDSQLKSLENLSRASPITHRMSWDARLQNMVERCGFISQLVNVMGQDLSAAIDNGSMVTHHILPAYYYRDRTRFGPDEMTTIPSTHLTRRIEAIATNFVRAPLGPAIIALLMGWWPYSGYEEHLLFDVLMNGIVLLVTNGLLVQAIERSDALRTLSFSDKPYHTIPDGSRPTRLDAFQQITKRPVADLLVMGRTEHCALFPPYSSYVAQAPYGCAVEVLGHGTYALVIRYKTTVSDPAGRTEYAVKFQPEETCDGIGVLSNVHESGVMCDLAISKIVTDQLSPYDGWIRVSDQTMHASNFVRLLDHQRFIGRLSKLAVPYLPVKFEVNTERMWQASVYERAPGSTLFHSTAWCESSVTLSSVIVQWCASMRTMSTACKLSHWDPGRSNCIYGPLKDYGAALGDRTAMVYRAPEGCKSGDLTVKLSDTHGNIIRIIDYSLSAAKSEKRGDYNGITTGLCLAGTFCPRMDVHLFACSIINAFRINLASSVHGPDGYRYASLGPVTAKLLRLLDAMILPVSAVKHLSSDASTEKELTYASFDLYYETPVTRKGKQKDLTDRLCLSLERMHESLPFLATSIESYVLDTSKPFTWPRTNEYMMGLLFALEDCIYLSYHVVYSLSKYEEDIFDTVLSLPYFDRYRVPSGATEKLVYMNEK